MNIDSFSLSFFVSRTIIGLMFTGMCLLILKPKNKSQFIGYATMGALPSIMAIGIDEERQFSCCVAGITYGALLIIFGLLFVKFEQPQAQSETAVEAKKEN